MNERWLPIPGYEGLYEVSDLARVRSWRPYNRLTLPALLTPYIAKNGYYYIKLRLPSGKDTNPTLHSVLTAAFFGPRPGGLVVRHLDGNPQNNSLSNLAYGTPTENMDDSVRHGTHWEAALTHCKRGHEFTPENTRREARPGGRFARRCLTCQREYGRQRYLSRRAAA